MKPQQQTILNEYLITFPQLYNAYFLKEFFYDIYDATTRKDATQQFHDWQAAITDDVAFAFNPLVKMLNNWYDGIFNYFDCEKQITNAYTESLNNVIRLTNRKGRGYSFEAIRAKILFSAGIKREEIVLQKKEFRDGNFYPPMSPHIQELNACFVVSTPISTLEQLLGDDRS